MKNKFSFMIIFLFLVLFFLSANGCKTTEPTTTDTQQTQQDTEETQEETKEENQEETKQSEETEKTQEEQQPAPVFDEEEASKLLEEAKLEIAKAQQMGAEEYSSEKFREAMELFSQAEKIYNEKKDFEAYKQIIEKARAMANLAHLEAAEKKYQQQKEEVLKLKDLISPFSNQEYYKDDLINADLLLAQAEEAKQNKDYVTALSKINEANSMYKKVYDSYQTDKNYVYTEFPKLLSIQNEMIDKKIKTIYLEDYNKFIQMFNQLKKSIDDGDFKSAKELLQMSYILGRNLIERYNQAVSIINQTEASRYLFQAKQAYEIAKEKENSFNGEQKKLLLEMENFINNAQQALDNEKYYDTISYSKEAIKIYLKLVLQNNEQYKTYVVRLIPERRDCLWRIAGYPFIYNNPYLWPLIWIANLDIITNPDLIFPGQTLIIPPLPQ